MKEVKAIIRPNRLDAVLDELHSHPGLPGVTVTQVQGFGKSVGRSDGDAGPVQYDVVSRVRLETVVPDALVDEVVGLICRQARTGRPGDGKITVEAVERAVRIRSGEQITDGEG